MSFRPASDAKDDELRIKVNEAWERYRQDPTPEKHAAFAYEVKVFSDWVLWNKLPEDANRHAVSERA